MVTRLVVPDCSNGPRDIPVLTALGSGSKQQDVTPETLEIHPVARTKMKSHFAHSLTNVSSISRIAMFGRAYAGQNSRPGTQIR
jgi:hypothetical protein